MMPKVFKLINPSSGAYGYLAGPDSYIWSLPPQEDEDGNVTGLDILVYPSRMSNYVTIDLNYVDQPNGRVIHWAKDYPVLTSEEAIESFFNLFNGKAETFIQSSPFPKLMSYIQGKSKGWDGPAIEPISKKDASKKPNWFKRTFGLSETIEDVTNLSRLLGNLSDNDSRTLYKALANKVIAQNLMTVIKNQIMKGNI